MVLKEEFVAWKNSEVYGEFWKVVAEQIAGLAAEIVNRESPAPERDMYVRGVVAGLKSVLEWEPEFPPEVVVEEEEDDDEI